MQYVQNLYLNSYIYFEHLSQMWDLLSASMKKNICFIYISTFYKVRNYNYLLCIAGISHLIMQKVQNIHKVKMFVLISMPNHKHFVIANQLS